MPRGYRHLHTSFAGGEMSPEMWSRQDDPRFRSGVARMRNLLSHPRGPAARRPGFELVHAAKESATAVRLLPFRFSADQTHAIEMGRATVDGREIGYFRFYTQGGILLQPRGDDYKAVDTADDITAGTTWNLTAATDLKTGDPIVLTMEAARTVTFDTATEEVIEPSHGFQDDWAILFRSSGALPPEIEAGRIYYVREQTPNRFKIGRRRGGQALSFSTTGTGTHTVACLPSATRGGDPFAVDVNTTYYAMRNGLAADEVGISATRADAFDSVVLDFSAGKGTVTESTVNIHYDYRPGSVAFDTGLGSPFYCRKTPWGEPGGETVNVNDHNDHAPADLKDYWIRQPGSSATVQFGVLTANRVEWIGHGLSDGDPVLFETQVGLPPEIIPNATYYVRDKDTNDFAISESVAGPLFPFTNVGPSSVRAFANSVYEVAHYYPEAALFDVTLTQSNDVLTLVHPDFPAAELRRLGATTWVLTDVEFNSVARPRGVQVEEFRGEAMKIASFIAGPPTVLTTVAEHTFTAGEQVYLTNGVGSGGGAVPADHYIVEKANGSAKTLQLIEFTDGDPVTASGSFTPGARLRSTPYLAEPFTTYVVTALDENDEESAPSAQRVSSTNLLVSGAYNTVSWQAVAGAERYRVYKDQSGLFGYIGEVDAPTTEFVDDNIAPDLSVTPPILDASLRRRAQVEFDIPRNAVLWVGHGLEAGAPVIFDTDGTLPNEIGYRTTYYVLDPAEDEFQLATTASGTSALVLTGTPSGVHLGISGHFPSAVAYFEQRRIFGGARQRPQDFWMTASGTEADLSYSIPTVDSDRIRNRLAARERSQIRHIVPTGHLILLTSAAEYRLSPLDSDALTPGSVSARAPTQVGVSSVAPVVVNNSILFPAARGGHIRELAFFDQVGDYVTGDVTIRAAHLFDQRTVVQMTYHKAPHPVVWAVSSAGTLLGFSYVPEEQIAGWHEHDTSGTIESCVAIEEGDEDRLYVVVNRSGTRFVERMGRQDFAAIEDGFFVDHGITYNGAAVSSLFVPHLAGQAVVYLADGVIGSGTVDGSGTLTLPTAASKVHVGLPYTSELRTLPLGMQVDAAVGSGRTKNINKVWVRVFESGSFEVGPDLAALSPSSAPAAGAFLSELVPVTVLGEWDEEGQLYIQADDPTPLTVVGLTLEVATGG